MPEEKVQQQIPQIFAAVAQIFRDADELRVTNAGDATKFLVADKGWQWFRDEVEKRLGYSSSMMTRS